MTPVDRFNASTRLHSTALEALVRVGAHHGLTLDADQLRRANPFDGPEPHPALLVKIAERAGFGVRRLKVGRGQLGNLDRQVPALLLLNDGKVALMSRVRTGQGAPAALLDDVETGSGAAVLVDEPRLQQIWSGEALLLKRRRRLTDEDRPFDFGWLVGQILRERRLFRDIAIASMLMSILSLVPAFMFMTIIDRVMIHRSYSTLMVLAVILVLFIGFETAFGFLRRRLTALAVARTDARISLHVFDRLLNLPLSFFERTSTGVVSSKIGQIWFIRQFLTEAVCGTLLDGITLFVLLPLLFFLSWQLTLIVLFLSIAILGTYVLFLPALGRKYELVIRAEQQMGAHQVETIHGIKTVKSLSLDGMKRLERDRFVAGVTEARRNLDFLSNVPQTIVQPLERLIYAGTFFIGCYIAMDPSPNASGATVGTIMAFSMLAGRVTAPIVQFAGLINGFEQARGAMAEVASVMNAPAEEGRSGTGLRQPILGHVEFDEVKFRYSPTAKPALDGVSFEIQRGTVFGVMGRSGSGKTTITRLLQGLSRDYEGLIKVDGMDLREIDLDHLRSKIGVVPQENFLFSGTIGENIAAARPNASFDIVVRAAQMAGAEEFIERLPDGYATRLQEGATNLSGGQRQRLAIARALLVDPPILVLDEATSALDAESEAIVNANLMRIAKDRTVIIISHRLSSLIDANAILVMERGKFYDMGTHDELVERCDIYKSLWYQQNRHLDPEARHAIA